MNQEAWEAIGTTEDGATVWKGPGFPLSQTVRDWYEGIPLSDTPVEETVTQHDDYVMKDDGGRHQYPSGSVREPSKGKPRFELLLPEGLPYEEQILTRFARLMEKGAQKYAERNWELADSDEELARFKEAALRHMMQWMTGERDEDHAAAVMFNVMAYETIRYKRTHV